MLCPVKSQGLKQQRETETGSLYSYLSDSTWKQWEALLKASACPVVDRKHTVGQSRTIAVFLFLFFFLPSFPQGNRLYWCQRLVISMPMRQLSPKMLLMGVGAAYLQVSGSGGAVLSAPRSLGSQLQSFKRREAALWSHIHVFFCIIRLSAPLCTAACWCGWVYFLPYFFSFFFSFFTYISPFLGRPCRRIL